MNVQLLVQVVNHITQHPEEWDQKTWHCGEKHSVLGWAQIMGGKPEDPITAYQDAKELLELSDAEAAWLRYRSRTIYDIYTFTKAAVDDKSYDKDGYDKDGYNKDGYDKNGHNKYRYDKDGYDRDGYDKDGYDKNGYGKDGYNEYGYDQEEYDQEGYGKEGYDRYGYDKYRYDKEGYDKYRYDKYSYGKNGYNKEESRLPLIELPQTLNSERSN